MTKLRYIVDFHVNTTREEAEEMKEELELLVGSEHLEVKEQHFPQFGNRTIYHLEGRLDAQEFSSTYGCTLEEHPEWHTDERINIPSVVSQYVRKIIIPQTIDIHR